MAISLVQDFETHWIRVSCSTTTDLVTMFDEQQAIGSGVILEEFEIQGNSFVALWRGDETTINNFKTSLGL